MSSLAHPVLGALPPPRVLSPIAPDIPRAALPELHNSCHRFPAHTESGFRNMRQFKNYRRAASLREPTSATSLRD